MGPGQNISLMNVRHLANIPRGGGERHRIFTGKRGS